MKPEYSYEEDMAFASELVAKLPFEKAVGIDIQRCWSFERDSIDPERRLDDIVMKYGNKVSCNKYLGNIVVLTIDGWLYMLDSNALKRRENGGNPTILLYRANWENIRFVEDGKIMIVSKEEADAAWT